jgi:hypothetical protein
MASNYAAFDVMAETTAGVPTLVPGGVEVAIRKEGSVSDEAESPLLTDSSGHIPAGSLASVAAGSTVYFRVEDHNGLAGTFAQITT